MDESDENDEEKVEKVAHTVEHTKIMNGYESGSCPVNAFNVTGA